MRLTEHEPEPESSIRMQPIGHVRSPFKQKFAIPRQANLVQQAIGEVVLEPCFSDSNAVRELEQFSHLWLLFHFHATADRGWTPTVQPPRLGGKTRVGVFASRSPFRPNGIGMSAVENLGYQKHDGHIRIRIGSIDLLDGTPLLDIKPYLPWADSLPEATSGFASQAPGKATPVIFSDSAESRLRELSISMPDLRRFIIALLQQDPRPAWRVRKHDAKQYGMILRDLNIKWHHQQNGILVTRIGDAGPQT